MFVRLLFLTALFSIVVLPAYSAELVTPGAGLTLSPADLAVQSASAGLDAIQALEDGYRIHGNITIASGDRLLIAPERASWWVSFRRCDANGTSFCRRRR
jgi:hypothetical protein